MTDSKEQFKEWYFRRYGKKDLAVVKDHAEFCDAWEVWQASREDIKRYEDEIAALQEQVRGLKERLQLVAELNDVASALHVEAEKQVRALAAENVSLMNSSVCTLQDGRPPHGFYASEWFIAKLKNGQYAALKALPEEYSHDYRTNDGTYYTKDWVVGWMQTPDTEYRPDVETPTTNAVIREIRAQAIEGFVEFNRKLAKDYPMAMVAKALEVTELNGEQYAARIRSGEQP